MARRVSVSPASHAVVQAVPESAIPSRRPVPVRTILATIALVLATVAALWVLVEVRRVLTWIVVAAFFAVALAPLVDRVQRRVTGGRRALATLLVFVVVLLALAALVAAFVLPLAREGSQLAGQLPQIVEDARAGRGPVGGLLDRTNALQYVQRHQAQIRSFAGGLTTPATGVLKGVATGVAGTVTIFVLAYLMVLEGPRVVDGSLALLPPERRPRVRRVAADCAALGDRLHLRQPAHQRHLRRADLRRAQGRRRALRGADLAVRRDRGPDPARRRHARGDRRSRRRLRALRPRRHRRRRLLRALPTAREPPAAAADPLAHRRPQPADGPRGDPGRRRARRDPRRAARHPDRRHGPGGAARPVGQPARPPEGPGDRGRGGTPSRTIGAGRRPRGGGASGRLPAVSAGAPTRRRPASAGRASGRRPARAAAGHRRSGR